MPNDSIVPYLPSPFQQQTLIALEFAHFEAVLDALDAECVESILAVVPEVWSWQD